MTGNEIAKMLKRHKGKVEVPILMPDDVFHVFAQKSDLIAQAEVWGSIETGMTLRLIQPDGYYRLQSL